MKLAVLGAGESGAGSAVLAKLKGYEVFVSDFGKIKQEYKDLLNAHGITWEEEQHSQEMILSADEVVKSPGIPDKAPIVKAIREKGIPVISEIEFAGRYCKAKTICITGSNGKTTTTSLIYHLLKTAGLNVGLAGNIGQSFALQVALENFDYYVIELSSFQLDGMYKFKADIAILMNITPDHLDRYEYKMENYSRSKFRVIQNMGKGDAFIYCGDDPETLKYLPEYKCEADFLPFSLNGAVETGAYSDGTSVHIKYNNSEFTMNIEELALKGKHNVYNSMAAAVAGHVLNLRKEFIRESLANFQGVEHRLEPVVKVRGITFINDSKATNINSSWYALESMTTPVVWIVGGVDKGNDYNELMELVKQKVKVIVCLGVDNAKIHATFEGVVPTIVDTLSAEEAVRRSYELAEKGDTVLLSPACASFDLFENYEDRGRQFKEAARKL